MLKGHIADLTFLYAQNVWKSWEEMFQATELTAYCNYLKKKEFKI